jgi:hypothetical protein
MWLDVRLRLCFCKKEKIETGSKGSSESKVGTRNEKTACRRAVLSGDRKTPATR